MSDETIDMLPILSPDGTEYKRSPILFDGSGRPVSSEPTRREPETSASMEQIIAMARKGGQTHLTINGKRIRL